MRLGLFVVLALVLLAWAGLHSAGPTPPERMLVVGVPAWGPTELEKDGRRIPAGCGPEAARLLLWYWEICLGVDLVRGDPTKALSTLHELMGTVTVRWEGVDQGLTWPWKFAEGLEAYLRPRVPGVRVHTRCASLAEVFDQAVELLIQGNLPVLLFDWEGRGGILPNHYALVVGYDRRQKELVVNPGWGYPFQRVPFSDPKIFPVQLFWPEGPELSPPQRTWIAVPEECPAVRPYGENMALLPWCGARRAVRLGEGLILLVWE